MGQNSVAACIQAQGYTLTLDNAFDFKSDLYHSFYQRFGACVFQNPVWLAQFYQIIAPNRDAKPIVLTMKNEQGELVCIVPLVLRTKMGVRLLEAAELGVTDYCSVLFDRALIDDPKFLNALREQASSLLPSYDVLRINKIRPEQTQIWEAVFNQTVKQHDFSSHATSLPSTYEEWTKAALSSKMRKSLSRKRKKFNNEISGVFEEVAYDDLPKALSEMRQLREGRFVGDLIVDDFVFEFYLSIAQQGNKTGFAKLFCLKDKDKTIGYSFGVTQGGRFNYLLIGCDYDTYGRYSPGYLLYLYMIEHWIDVGGDVFDFTIGDEPFKPQLGAKETYLYCLRHGATLWGRLNIRFIYSANAVSKLILKKPIFTQ